MITKVISVDPDETVQDAMTLFDEYGIRTVPVLDQDKKVVGVFSFSHLLRGILPTAATFDSPHQRIKHIDVRLDQFLNNNGFTSERLLNAMKKKVKDVMSTEGIETVHPDTPLREAVRLLLKYGSPLAVIDEDTEACVGLISSQSAVKALLVIAEKEQKA